jgi:YHS domain-containing protein
MKKKLFTSALTSAIAVFLFTACQSGPAKTEEKPKTDTVAMTQDSSGNAFEHLLVDNGKDPSCGMPTSAGIHDTAHYKDKVLGFCSKECKEAFQKDPEKLIAAAELKK